MSVPDTLIIPLPWPNDLPGPLADEPPVSQDEGDPLPPDLAPDVNSASDPLPDSVPEYDTPLMPLPGTMLPPVQV